MARQPAAAAEHAAAAAREAARAQSEQHAPEPGTKYGVGQIFLGIRYLRLVDARSMRPVLPLVPLLCRACDRTLSYTDQLLCTKRRWGFGAGPPENACFTNSLVRGQFEARGEYEEHRRDSAEGNVLEAPPIVGVIPVEGHVRKPGGSRASDGRSAPYLFKTNSIFFKSTGAP